MRVKIMRIEIMGIGYVITLLFYKIYHKFEIVNFRPTFNSILKIKIIQKMNYKNIERK